MTTLTNVVAGRRVAASDLMEYVDPATGRALGEAPRSGETEVDAAVGAAVVWINCHQVMPAEVPHGGFKQSGTGKDLSTYGLDDYTRIKHVMTAHV